MIDYKNQVLKNKLGITDYIELKKAENHFYTLGLEKLKGSIYFTSEPEFLQRIQFNLFKELYDWAGKYRIVNVERPELILGGLSVNYSDFKQIKSEVDNAFLEFNKIRLRDLSTDEQLEFITNIVIKLWQIHPFRDCNTRTIIAFIYQYCSNDSLFLDIDLLSNNLGYFRKSLVAATFSNEDLNVSPNKSYLQGIMRDAFKSNHQR